MDNKFIGLMVGLTVGVLMVSGFLWPIVADATATESTFENEGLFNAVSLDSASSHTVSFDYTAPNKLIVDSVEVDMSGIESPYSSATVVFSDDWFVRFVPDTGVILYKCGTSSASAIKGATASSQISFNLAISEGTATFTYSDETTYTYNVDGAGLIISPNKGDYVLKASNDTAFVSDTSIVYGVGRTDRALGTGGTSFNAMVKASVNDGVEAIAYSPQYTWNDNRTVNTEEVAGYEDLYSITSFSFNLVDTNEEEHPITYNQIFVPAEVTAEKSWHLDTMQIAMIGVIGTLGAIVLIAAAAGSIRRLD